MTTSIGSSIIYNKGGSTGPTGPSGPSGSIGSIGLFNSATGPIGNTALYIVDVTSDLVNDTITFIRSDSNFLSVTGFQGPGANISNLDGVSAYINPLYFSALSSVIGGSTFEFFGICGAGTISSNLSSDKTEIILSRSTTFPGITYGNTAANLLIYTTSDFSATTTKIGITGASTNSVLSFGLTAHKGATTTNINVYADFTESYYEINFGITLGYSLSGITKDSVIIGNDNGGLILDLTNYTTYKIKTPIGITSIVGIPNSTVYQFYTLFIDGADVWNFPANVKFDNSSPSGISGFGFLDGMNIINLFSTDGGSNWLAAFTAKGIGDSNLTYDYSQIGSCTINGICTNNTTRKFCKDNGGSFESMILCGSDPKCIIGTACYDSIPTSICSTFGGTSSLICPATPSFTEKAVGDILIPNNFIVEKYITYKRNTVNKKINNNCINICCDGIESYCQSLGDC